MEDSRILFFFLVNKVKYKLIDFLPKLNIDLV